MNRGDSSNIVRECSTAYFLRVGRLVKLGMLVAVDGDWCLESGGKQRRGTWRAVEFCASETCKLQSLAEIATFNHGMLSAFSDGCSELKLLGSDLFTLSLPPSSVP